MFCVDHEKEFATTVMLRENAILEIYRVDFRMEILNANYSAPGPRSAKVRFICDHQYRTVFFQFDSE
jgi:hypothetical protein